jgi:hypothetical protein
LSGWHNNPIFFIFFINLKKLEHNNDGRTGRTRIFAGFFIFDPLKPFPGLHINEMTESNRVAQDFYFQTNQQFVSARWEPFSEVSVSMR